MLTKFLLLVGLAAAVFMLSSSAYAAEAVTAGDLVIEPSTLHCLGFEWPISGDDNRNAAVAVAYRPKGVGEWRQGLPLLRLGGETVMAKYPKQRYIVPHMFAGSIFDLQPGAEYEVRLTLSDPDGGKAEKTVTVSTRRAPIIFEGGKKIHVYPADFKGEKTQPAFDSLQTAFDAATPGDQVLVHAGKYVGHYVFTHGGTVEKPIVIRGAGDGEAILANDKHREMFNITKADYLWFENLTFRDPGTGDGGNTVDGVVLLAGNRSLGIAEGCKGLVVRRCKFEDFGVGVMASNYQCRNFTITDNEFTGRQDWTIHDGTYKEYLKMSYVAIWMCGAGHDVAYNRIRCVHDGIDISCGWENVDRSDPGFTPARKSVSIDFYNNDIGQVGDDFIETDSGANNIRVYRNRCVNSQVAGLSAQPVFGGPVYFIRNVLYNIARGDALKFNCEPAGLIVYHNTIINFAQTYNWSNGHFRNNIFLGLSGDKTAMARGTYTDYSTTDYNGYMAGLIGWAMPKFGWIDQEKWEVKWEYFPDLKAFAAATGYETHGVVLGYDAFEKMEKAEGLTKVYDPASVNFNLKANGPAVDAGCILPNVNDGYTGKTPDLGARELGVPPPHYGPRD